MEGLSLIFVALLLFLLCFSASPDCHQMRAIVRAEFSSMTGSQLVDDGTVWPRAKFKAQLP